MKFLIIVTSVFFISGCHNSVIPLNAASNSQATSTTLAVPQRENLLAEYLLQEGSGTVINDTSGKGNTGTLVGATWDGAVDLNFQPPSQYIQLPTALNQLNTLQVAVYAPIFGTTTNPKGYGDMNGFPANQSILCGTTTSLTCLIATCVAGHASHFCGYNSSGTEASEALTGGWHIVTIVSDTTDHIYYDGNEVSSYAHQAGGMFLHASSGNYQLGGSSTYTGTWWLGKVAAAWAWSTALNNFEVATAYQTAIDFIHSKGVITKYNPIVHTGPMVVGGLDSRTEGVGVTGGALWIKNLTLTDNTYTAVDLGSSGAQIHDALNMFDLTYAPYINSQSGNTIVAFWGGINEFLYSTFTARQTANAMEGLVRKSKALGARVVVATEISATGVDALRDSYNTIIRNEAFSWGADNIVDLATIPQMGADGTSSNTTYFGDGIHPNDTGEAYIRSAMNNGINELLGSTNTSRHSTAAASYTEVAGDDYLDLTGAGAQTITLPDCIGYSLPREIVNVGSNAATLATQNAESLTGSTTIAVNGRAALIPVPGPANTAGCSWLRVN